MAGSKRGHNSRYQARNERGQFAVKTEVYYISSDDDVAPAGTRSAGANRVKEVAPSKFKKTRTAPPVKGGKGKGQASTPVKKKGNPAKKVPGTSHLNAFVICGIRVSSGWIWWTSSSFLCKNPLGIRVYGGLISWTSCSFLVLVQLKLFGNLY